MGTSSNPTIRELAERSAEYDQQKHDHTANANRLYFNSDAQLHVPSAYGFPVQPLTPTQNAWAQLFAKLAPTVYGKGSKRTLPNIFLVSSCRKTAYVWTKRVL